MTIRILLPPRKHGRIELGHSLGKHMDMFDKIGLMIRNQRLRLGLSRMALAERAGVGKTVVFEVENGKASVQFDTLSKILSALDIQVRFRTNDLNIAFKQD